MNEYRTTIITKSYCISILKFKVNLKTHNNSTLILRLIQNMHFAFFALYFLVDKYSNKHIYYRFRYTNSLFFCIYFSENTSKEIINSFLTCQCAEEREARGLICWFIFFSVYGIKFIQYFTFSATEFGKYYNDNDDELMNLFIDDFFLMNCFY